MELSVPLTMFMEPRLTQTQLAQVVAEIERLSQQREAELDQQQVKEILRELNLPDDLLADALIQVQRRAALQNQRRRNRWLAIAITTVVIAAIALFGFWRQGQQQAIGQVAAGQERISLTQEGRDNLNQIDRQTNPRVYYHVTLQNATVGSQLSLQCDWVAPNGQIAHQNNYQTRPITTPVWNTFCFYNLGAGATPGTWEVRLTLEGRVLSTQTFVVQ